MPALLDDEVETNAMLIERIFHRGLAQASYLIGCETSGKALVVDPNRAIEQYCALAGEHGLCIVAVAETHIHADFLSGARELAAHSGGALYLSAAGGPEWQYAYAGEARPLCDGDVFEVGTVRVRALHTPGHTPEHLAFLVTDGDAGEAVGMASGDFVFVGDVGRPDLLERAAGAAGTMEVAARRLYASLERFRALPEYMQLWPGHGAGSACGKALGALPQSTVGYELRHNWAFRPQSEAEFVAAVLDQPAPPPYFAQMKRLNQRGPSSRLTGALARLAAGETHDQLQVIDIRPAEEYAAGHLPGALNLPLGDSMLRWAGWFVQYDRPLGLIGTLEEARQARDELLLIGLDDVAGVIEPEELANWLPGGVALEASERMPAAELLERVEQRKLLVLDVRAADEYAEGHVPGAVNIPLGELPERAGELPQRPIVVHCEGGYRSAVASSLLQAAGRRKITDMCDGFAGWKRAGGAVER
jgi:hydroxyacylglutathione hydrolase